MPRSAVVLLAIAAGSALGGVARYLLGTAIQARTGDWLPYGTLAVNFLACLLIGWLFVALRQRADLSPAVQLFLTAGFCGGFSTFSALALDTALLVGNDAVWRATLNLAGSLLAGLAGVRLGMVAARWLPLAAR